MKILITSAFGKLGTRLREALDSNHELVLINHASIDAANAKYYVADLNDRDQMATILSDEKPQAIIHLSSLLGPECERDEARAQKINVEATKILAELAAEHGVKKFLFASSGAVYRQTRLEPTSEEDNVEPVSIYAKTKLAAEKVLQQVANETDLQGVVFRIFNIYGPTFDRSLVNMLLASAEDKPVTLLGPDNCYRDYIHVDDAVTAMLQALEAQFSSNFTVLNIGSGVATSNSALIEAIKRSGTTPHYTTKPGELSLTWADITRSKALIHFEPTKSLGLQAGRLYI